MFHTRESYLFKRNDSALLQWVDIDWWPLVNVVGMKLSTWCTVLRNNSKYATEYWFIVLQHFTVMNREKTVYWLDYRMLNTKLFASITERKTINRPTVIPNTPVRWWKRTKKIKIQVKLNFKLPIVRLVGYWRQETKSSFDSAFLKFTISITSSFFLLFNPHHHRCLRLPLKYTNLCNNLFGNLSSSIVSTFV